ncbi:MAG: HPt (histidine-containing phosphotransfer) domain-containing protein [Gammaproteobacteria bacterium]|jgi:HPt (histidine-containing phosphotransfer) domain-containing protein
MSDISAVDEESMAVLRDAMGEDFAELITVFIESTQEILTQLEQAFEQQDIESFTRHAHSLKSSSANLGGLTLSAMAAELEQGGQRQQWPESASFILALKQEFSRMEKELQQYQT